MGFLSNMFAPPKVEPVAPPPVPPKADKKKKPVMLGRDATILTGYQRLGGDGQGGNTRLLG
jgi:hypothetical protein